MKTGKDILDFMEKYLGSKYDFGAFVPKDKKDYVGSFDCAEFVSYGTYQCYGFLYGCSNSTNPKTADAYTGFFDRDAHAKGIIISTEEATRTEGAILLRVPKAGAIGHVVLSKGNGKTREANSTKYGCIDSVVTGRRWDYGIKYEGVQYNVSPITVSTPPTTVYRLKQPYMQGAFVKLFQKALGLVPDGIYGPKTQEAVVAYQKKTGLIADGEIMPGGQTAKSLKLV